MATQAQQQSFLSRLVPLANTYGQQYNIDPHLIVAQAALESNWGTSAPNNNFFGIKGPGTTETTTEYIDGSPVTTTSSFKGYSSLEDSVKGYAQLLSSSPRYSNVLGKVGSDAVSAVAGDGYATDPSYASKLNGISNSVASTGQDISNLGASLEGKAIGAAETAAGFASGNPLLIAKGIGDLTSGGSGEPSALDKLLTWLKGVFSANTAARFVAVIVGVVLIAIALAYLTGADKAVKVAVGDTAKALRTAAVVAA